MPLVDLRWMSQGGLLIDGTGDLACTADDLESLRDVAQSRLKAAVDGWQLYRVGAGLDELVGSTIDAELELQLRRRVARSLTDNFLPPGGFQIETLPDGDRVHVMVYIGGQLVAKTEVAKGA